jgi:8-oxo-dGTP pyrophosphatase MutT (NUDIX family)
MTISYDTITERPSWLRSLTGMFRRPARLQIAALCKRERDGNKEVLLITSKSTRRWILPKGWPVLSYNAHRTAAIEAFEEAGVIGTARSKPFASFQSHKGGEAGLKIRTEVLVFLVDVESTTTEFPEYGKRDVRWVSIDEAIKLTDEPSMAKVFLKLKS